MALLQNPALLDMTRTCTQPLQTRSALAHSWSAGSAEHYCTLCPGQSTPRRSSLQRHPLSIHPNLRACRLVLCPSAHCRPAYCNWWLRHCSSANRYCHSGLDVPSSTLGCQSCLLTTWMKSMMVLGHPVLPCSLLLFGFSHHWIRNLHYPWASCSTYQCSVR